MNIKKIPTWLIISLPLVLLAALVIFFLNTNPIQINRAGLPPIEEINIDRIILPEAGTIQLEITNTGPDPVTIAQVLVDDAYWQFSITPHDGVLGSLQSGTVVIPYPWVYTEPHEVVLISSTGVTFSGEIEVSVQTPQLDSGQLRAYALVGIYVGVIPVGLGLLWFPAMRRFSNKVMDFILSLTVGLLIFLLIDTYLEMAEVAELVPGIYQGMPLGLFLALLTWLAIVAVGGSKGRSDRTTPEGRRFLAFLIALGIGFHNLGEGLVVGAAFALGEAALGSFLVVGFILHNITEGVGIAAPVAKDQPRFGWWLLMLLIAGAPAVLGTLIGGFAFSPLLTVIFLGIGVGAIWQVIVEVSLLVIRSAERSDIPAANWGNILGLLSGFLIMYFTAFMVKF